MANLQDWTSEMLGYVPKLSYLLAQKLVQRAWRDIRDARRWGFLKADGVLFSPNLLNAGTAAVTLYSPTVIGSAPAAAAWQAEEAALGPSINLRQFRIGTGPVYNITAFDGINTLTLDRMYQEASNATAGYQLYQCYYPAPVADFLRWMDVVNPITQYRFRRRNLHRSKEEIDRRDPGRNDQGEPFWMGAYKYNDAGFPMFEMWPHSIQAVGFQVLYQRRGADLTSTQTLPGAVSEAMLLERARAHASLWAMTNQGRYPELALTRWDVLLAIQNKAYTDMLTKAKTNDEEAFPQNFSEDEDNSALSGPIDASFMQSHDLYVVE